MKRACPSRPAIAALLTIGLVPMACGGPSQQSVTLTAEDVRAVRALPTEDRREIEVGARTVHTGDGVVAVEGTDSSSRFSPPLALRSALEEADAEGDVRVVFGSPPSDSAATVVDVGAYTALVGGAAAGVGVLMILGAAAIGGPAHDYSDVMVGGGVTFLIGAGVATIGGLTALSGYVAGHPEGSQDPIASVNARQAE